MAEQHNLQKLITEHIDLWTGAVKDKSSAGRGGSSKRELYGIKKLRELILELAVRGKLVAQDPSDEPASVLLERIAAEKAELVKQGKIKKPKKLPAISEEEKPFELPKGWVCVRLGEVINISSGNGLTAKQMNIDGGIPVYGGNGITGYHDQQNVAEPTLVIGRVGFYCGSIHITPAKAWVTDNAFITQFSSSNISLYFLAKLLKATNLKENENATAQPVISGRKIYPIVINIPPYNEQLRIVAKVDELMALCDQLEQQTESSLDAHETLVRTLLDTLLQSADAKELEQNWQRLSAHFDLLFTTEQSIDQLKQTILQLAVMGKLVPQNPNDEPASELLKRIAAEKEELIQKGCIKKSRSTDSIIEDHCNWSIASNWLSIELQDIFRFIDYRGKNPEKSSSGIRLITAKNIRNGYINNDPIEFITEELYHSWMIRGLPQKQDILFITEGHTMGYVAQAELDFKFALAQRTICLHAYANTSPKYLLFSLMSNQFQKAIKDNETGSAAGGIKASKLKRLKLPIPPLEEQHRIVAKVDQLMALCNQLKAKLADSKTTQLYLTDALVAQSV